MSTGKFKYENIKPENEHNVHNILSIQGDSGGGYNRKTDVDNLNEFFREDPQIFLLNNILMSVQFFDNYDREIETLRENWYDEISLEGHQKQYFQADCLFKLVSKHVKFKPRHGINKYQEFPLHPFRIFVSFNNVDAVFDPGNFKQLKTGDGPYYQLTIKLSDNNKKDKSGFVSLLEHKSIQLSKDLKIKNKSAKNPVNKSLNLNVINSPYEKNSAALYLRRKSAFAVKNTRRLTKTEKIIGLHNKNVNFGRKSSFRYFTTETEEMIPNNGFYIYKEPKARLKSQSIHDFRMNTNLENSLKIPRKCFQTIEVKTMSKLRKDSAVRKSISNCFKTQTVLNATAFMSYFCDLLIEKLCELLNFESDFLDESVIRQEFIIINKENIENYVTPTITITDWNKHMKLEKKSNKSSELEWPSLEMNKIINILPCYAVPKGFVDQLKENDEYEKEWMLVFPKAEKFLLMHMMHAHLRCYFIVLAIYKSFIELEVSPVSFGEKHLMHLLFWEVQKNFTAWPEDRQGETLIRFLKLLYRKLQNKKLRDFFITSRNLFADSLPKDLHKIQVILKRILENPVRYVLRALRNLCFQPDFYPILDTLKLNSILTNDFYTNSKVKSIKPKKKKEQKTVRFEDDEEREWKKTVIRQINLEKKLEENDQISRLSVESINTENNFTIDTQNFEKCYQIVEIFILHFVKMGLKSVEYESLDQALGYLYQVQKLFELTQENIIKINLILITEKISELREKCDKLRSDRLLLKPQKYTKYQKKNEKVPKYVTLKEIKKESNIFIHTTDSEKKGIDIKDNEELLIDDEDEYETKL